MLKFRKEIVKNTDRTLGIFFQINAQGTELEAERLFEISHINDPVTAVICGRSWGS